MAGKQGVRGARRRGGRRGGGGRSGGGGGGRRRTWVNTAPAGPPVGVGVERGNPGPSH